MPRCARPHLDGWPLHVMQRGHNKRACFVEERDYVLYLALLEEAAALHGCEVHAYVAMTNHVHLVVTPETMHGLSRALKRVGERYAAHFNRSYGLSGAIWDGRFKASVIDSDAYLLCCYRYVELNPVRAGMVAHPADYRWSSYGANARGQASDLVMRHGLYLELGADREAREAAYRRFVAMGCSDAELEQIRDAVRAGTALASPEFLASFGGQLGTHAVRRPRGRPRRSG